MKTTLLFLAIGLLSFQISAQQIHSISEELFEGKTLAAFENKLNLSNADYTNQALLDFVDFKYQEFRLHWDSLIDSGMEISEDTFNEWYEKLIVEVKSEMSGIKPAPDMGTSAGIKMVDGPCVNMDYETGDFTGWTLTRGDVTGAAPYSYASEIPVGPGAYHTIFGPGVDPVTGISTVNPAGGSFSARLGNGNGTGAKAARLKQTFLVDPTNYMFTYSYAVIFQSPNGHSLNQLPYFTVRVFDSLGNSIPCGEYSVIADAANASDYLSINWGGSTVLYKDWSTVFTNLLAYIGQNVTVEFTAGDCSLGGHFGYAYVDASCGIDQLTASNDIICVGDSALLSAPSGAMSYLWSNGATTQSTMVYAGGTYSCTITPFQGAGCELILDITISENPSPIANFSSTAGGCVGTGVDFTDLSTIPLPGVITSYRWDFGDGIVTPLSSGAIVAVPNTSGTYIAPNHIYATPGLYNAELYVESADGCKDSITIPMNINPLPLVVAGPNQTVCFGESVVLSGSGAIAYSWDNGVTDGVSFVPVLGTTTYTVTGTDGNGCVNTDQVDVLVNPLPAVNAGVDQTVCDGASVILAGSGATSYVWDNGITNGIAFVPAVGTTIYTVTGTDGNGCTNTDQVNVLVNPLPNVNAGVDQTVCLGTSVTLIGTGISGSGANTYVWDNGVTNGIPFVPGVGTTTYTVTGTDGNGCVNTDQVNVLVNPLPVVNAGPDQTVCEGTSVTLNGSGATSYLWSNGIMDGVPFVPPVGTTTYTVTGTDGNGCVNTDQVDVLVNPLPAVNAGVDQTVCDGASVILSGSGATSYVWDNGVTNGIAFVPAVGTTTYTVTGTDGNGCTNTDQVNVLVNPLPNVNAGVDQTICSGASVTLIGTGIPGSGANTYVWDNGVTNGIPFVPGVGTTTYTVTGTDANGCVNTDQVNVLVNPLPVVNAGVDQTVCEGASVTLNGSGAASYLWNNGILDGVSFVPPVGTTTYTVTGTDVNGCVNTDQVNVLVNPLPAVNAGIDQIVCDGASVILAGSGATSYVWDNGVTNGAVFVPSVGTTTYTVTGTDANGCVNTDQVNVLVNPLPNVNAGVDQTVCFGTSVTLIGTGIPGSGANTYVWDNGVTNGIPFVPGVGTITYTVKGTDANGCVNTDQVDVTVNPLPNVNAGLDQTVCEGASVTLNASGAMVYVWSNGVTDGVSFVPPVGTTTYTVTGTDGNGCVNTDQVNVLVNPLPAVNAGIDQIVCDGASVILAGSGATSYVWDNGVTNGAVFIPSLGTTTYTVTGTDGNGCVNTDQVNVLVNPLPNVNAGVDQTVCSGTSVTLIGTGIPGSGANTYVWDNGVTNGIPFVPGVGTITYTVKGTDANGCVNTDQVDVTVNPLPNVNAGLDQTACEGASVTLNASGAIVYVWSNGVTDGVSFVPSVGTTTYTVTGTDGNGCVNTDQVNVLVNPLPAVNAGIDQIVCDGASVILTGSGAALYVWDNGITNGIAFIPSLGTTTYTVTGTDGNGCVNTDQVNVLVNPLPVVNAGVDQTVCSGTSVTLIGTGIPGSGANTYVWDNGVANGVPFIPGIGVVTYVVTGTNANGCINTDQVDVTVNPLPNVNAGPDQAVCEGEFITLSGSGAMTYIWDNGVTDGIAFVPSLGTTIYTVTGTDGNGCVNSDHVNVTVNPLPEISGGFDQKACDGEWIVLNAAGSPNLYWSNGIVNNVPFQQPVGVVNYIVYDSLATGCTATDTVNVEIFANPIITANDAEICEGEGVVLLAQGGVSYSWSDGVQNGVEFFPVTDGTYTVVGTDMNGCSSQASSTIVIHYAPDVDFKILNLSLTTVENITGFDNLTTGAVSYSWDFGDGSSNSSEFEPTHAFPTDHSSEYAITLTAFSDFGCPGTKIKYVHVFQDYTIYVPNAFTPDGNGKNEIFKPIMEGFDEDKFTLYIFNRWGELVFESHNMEVGWDGKYARADFGVQDGVYTWKIEAGLKDSADTKIFVGHVALLK